MIIAGCDPGKDGAIVFMSEAGAVLHAMPTIESAKGRPEYDVPKIAELLHAAEHVFIEKLQPMPMKHGGSIANYQRGMGLGLLVGICTAKRIAFTLVRPQDWQREMLAGTSGEDTKQRAIVAAQRLFPDVDLRRTPRCTKLHDGFADALLIAEWGRRT
jgi:hypothetical protein